MALRQIIRMIRGKALSFSSHGELPACGFFADFFTVSWCVVWFPSSSSHLLFAFSLEHQNTMGNILSPVFKTIAPCLAEQVKYISGLEDNLKALKDAILKLEAISADVLAEVGIQERQGLLPLQEVRLWLSNVEAIGPQVCVLLDANAFELRRLCMYGYCSNDLCLTYPYAKEVWKKLKIVELLLSTQRADEVVARRGLPPDMEEGPTRHTVGLESMLESTWKCLMDDEVGILGIYGMGGIGKTTLLEQINNKFLERKHGFDVVISVVVSQDVQIGRIQKEVGKRLGLSVSDTQWEEKTKNEKASDIKKVLTRKRFVVLVDDVWRKVVLEEIGVPLPSTENRSKVVFTTRSKEVCGRMGADLDMEVKCLEPENAWKLFQKKVRATTLASDPKIPELARKVCEKCKGLPLALSVIGETMACKTTVREWLYAVDVLDSYAAENPKVEEEILKILKFSYDDLKDERVKQCLQYCALFPEDHKIDKDMLVDYWICEGIIVGDREKAMNQGYGIIGILVSACLLMNFEYTVVMHDVVRQMALWIASNFGEEKENFVVRTGAGLHQIPEVGDWNAVRRMSLQNNEIHDISVTVDCSNLTTLLLSKNKLVNISGEFFLSMPKLVVLDLSFNDLNKLPEEVSKLVSLRYLSLKGTNLEYLPPVLGKLIQLRHLDLSFTPKLQSISVISSLLNLETLNVRGSAPLTLESLEHIKLLKKLQILSLSIREFLVLESLSRTSVFASCSFELQLSGLKALNGIVFVGVLASLQKLAMVDCCISDITVDLRNTTSLSVRPSDVCFQNLKTVSIQRLKGMEDLTWLMFAPSLTDLNVRGPSPELKEIISRNKAADILNGRQNIRPFAELKRMTIYALEELTSIYWEPLPFPYLKSVLVARCPKLKKLPLNMESSKGNRIKLVAGLEQLEGIEWEDEATKERFSTTSDVFTHSLDPMELLFTSMLFNLLKGKHIPRTT